MAPVVKGRRATTANCSNRLAKKGYIYARIDGEIREISSECVSTVTRYTPSTWWWTV